MIASPSLADSSAGARPARASASPPGSRSPSNVASPSPISTSPRWASGARSPDEPTDPLLGITGVTWRSSSASTSSTSSTRTPEWPRRSEEASSSSIPRTTSSGSGGPEPTACERRRLTWSCAASDAAIRTFSSRPKPVVTP